MNSDIKLFAGVIAATLLLVVMAIFFFGKESSKTLGTTAPKSVTIDSSILVREDSWSEGSASAKVTVVEFGDFQCPACKNTEPTTEQLRTKYKDKIRFVWRNFPLTQVHEFGFDSALAVEAAGKQGKFWDYHKKLFEISPDLQKDKLEKLAKDLGLNIEQFTKDRDSDSVRQRVLNDQADGNRAGVNSTPTYFINGDKLTLNHLPTLSDFSSRIDPLLK